MKRITLDEYKSLPAHEQEVILFKIGEFLDSQIYKDRIFALYAVEMFFVEIEYDVEKLAIINKRVFKSGQTLNKYSTLSLGRD